MNTFKIWAWYDPKIISKAGEYEQGQVFDMGSLHPVLDDFINVGLNVMLYHGKDQMIFYVDDKRFSQR